MVSFQKWHIHTKSDLQQRLQYKYESKIQKYEKTTQTSN